MPLPLRDDPQVVALQGRLHYVMTLKWWHYWMAYFGTGKSAGVHVPSVMLRLLKKHIQDSDPENCMMVLLAVEIRDSMVYIYI